MQGIKLFPDALDSIIVAKGACAYELDNRKGRRARNTRKYAAHSDCADVRADDARRLSVLETEMLILMMCTRALMAVMRLSRPAARRGGLGPAAEADVVRAVWAGHRA
eukprot:CAMPEP_0119421364 /NCGR_PEP_ID=MMETSP1335-20130426/25742_1 /TAXON_ID=259385 /ORGANISM="Chrysoculter rhomboideus, Strain RCC1486" /LENGTH=107 /DNA_ID=CAMNT_0007446771 /DNA_START=136 /DNA_END=460 /DNA_ORIENTATION=-